MRTFLRGAAIVLVVWTLADLAGRYLELGAPGSVPASMPSTMLAMAALIVAAIAIVLAVLALRNARGARREADAIIRALDLALRERAGAGRSLDVRAINDIVAREVAQLAAGQAGVPAPRKAEAPAEPGPPAFAPAVARPMARTEQDRDVERLVAGAIAEGTVEISLRPIVSLARGAAAAFDVFAHFDAGPDRQVDIGRIGDSGGATDVAAFERLMVMEAIAASRRIVGDGEVPLHVPVSQALLSSQEELAAVLETARTHPAAAASIVLDLPMDLAAGRGAPYGALGSLADAGFAFAAEAGEAAALDAAALRLPGAGWVRLPTERLKRARALAGHEFDGHEFDGHEFARRARDAGLAIIADEMKSDNDAIALADLGVDLMAGPRFSGPRRLRRELGQVSRAAAE